MKEKTDNYCVQRAAELVLRSAARDSAPKTVKGINAVGETVWVTRAFACASRRGVRNRRVHCIENIFVRQGWRVGTTRTEHAPERGTDSWETVLLVLRLLCQRV